jgi:diguanylate cyclase (GGDEF)-like protein
MDRKMHDRRSSDDSDRRKSRGISLLQGQDELRTRNETSRPFAIADAESSHEKSVSSRENAVVIREEAIEERESDLHRREGLLALQEGKSFAHRVQEISDAQLTKVAQEDRNSKLKKANEALVIASVQFQTMAEEREKSELTMSHLATHDFLTDLPNRMLLSGRITQAIAFVKRHNEKLAVLFIDLDRFKIVNDTLGHAIGDQLLQAVAQRLKSVIRSSDIISRHGGDEFIIVLSEVNQEKALALNVEEIHAIITVPYSIAGHDLLMGATIGISIFPQDGEDAETLICNADDAMYYAKENGRNKYQFFGQEVRTRVIERQRVDTSLYQALETGR